MSVNPPKVTGDYLCNSHLPISELQVHGWGPGLATHSCACINRITICGEMFWTFKVLSPSPISLFLKWNMFVDWRLELFQGLDGRETPPGWIISMNSKHLHKQLRWWTTMKNRWSLRLLSNYDIQIVWVCTTEAEQKFEGGKKKSKYLVILNLHELNLNVCCLLTPPSLPEQPSPHPSPPPKKSKMSYHSWSKMKFCKRSWINYAVSLTFFTEIKQSYNSFS